MAFYFAIFVLSNLKLICALPTTINVKSINFQNAIDPAQTTNFPYGLRNEKGMYLYMNRAGVSYSTLDSNKYLDGESWTLNGWYYSCTQGDYQLISK